jgi:hypothetical protein
MGLAYILGLRHVSIHSPVGGSHISLPEQCNTPQCWVGGDWRAAMVYMGVGMVRVKQNQTSNMSISKNHLITAERKLGCERNSCPRTRKPRLDRTEDPASSCMWHTRTAFLANLPIHKGMDAYSSDRSSFHCSTKDENMHEQAFTRHLKFVQGNMKEYASPGAGNSIQNRTA